MRYQGLVGSTQVDCELGLEGWPEVQVVVGGQPLDLCVKEIGPGRYWFGVGERSVEAAVVRTGDGYSVRVGSRTFRVSLLEGRRRLGRAGSGTTGRARDIRAPMPGRVVQVLVQDGDKVESNQGLVVLEAMKMQNEMRSPCRGTVRSIRVQEGMSVNAGDLLATVE